MGEDDVGNLEGQDGVEIPHLLCAVLGDDAGGVEQTLRDDDGIANRERFKRLGQHGAATDRPGEGDVVVSQDIACEGFEGLVELAGSIDEAGLEEAFDDIVLRLLDPRALGAEGAYVLGIVADIGSADDIH